MIKTIRKTLAILTPKEKRKLLFLLFPAVLTSTFETAGIAVIAPFMAMITSPNIILENSTINGIYQLFSFGSIYQFLMFSGAMALTVIVLGNLIGLLTTRKISKFIHGAQYSISTRLLSTYLNKPYQYFLDKNSSSLTKNVLAETSTTIHATLSPILSLFSRSISTIFIISLILYINPLLGMTALAVSSLAYSIIYILVRKKLLKISTEMVECRDKTYKAVSEGFGGIKLIKLAGNEQNFLKGYTDPAKVFLKNTIIIEMISILPRHIMEMVSFGGVIAIVLFLFAANYNTGELISVLVLYAFAGYRMLPHLHNIFVAISQITSNMESLNIVYNELSQDSHEHKYPRDLKNNDTSLSLEGCIQLKNITYAYPKTITPVLKNINITIPARTTVGFVGETGAGKTTIVDIIMGLLEAEHGKVTIDNRTINYQNLKYWQKCIGYVPQQIYLCDDTITQNIAFGIPPNDISQDAVRKAAQIANLEQFIENELPLGYETIVGERGIRLSGGQQQRIGIARALYHDPEMIVLDEATSSLDGITENIIIEAIENLAHKKTIIFIAHRLSTVKNCDMIYFLSGGIVRSTGTYEQLFSSDQQFRKMAQKDIKKNN